MESCPGYRASNVVSTGSTLTADLTLNGPACNVYGTDLTELKLVVEYQTGMFMVNPKQGLFYTNKYDRYPSSCSDLRRRPTSLSGKKAVFETRTHEFLLTDMNIRSLAQWLIAQIRPLRALLRMPLSNSTMSPAPFRFQSSVKEAKKSSLIHQQRP